MRNLILALALILTGCATHVGGRANYREITIAKHWVNAQHIMAEYTNNKSYDVPYAIFTWKFDDKAVHLTDGEELRLGLGNFNPLTMEIFIAIPYITSNVIEHEACHAILFVLGDRRFVEYCHESARPWVTYD